MASTIVHKELATYTDIPPTISRDSKEGTADYKPPTFPIGPFTKFPSNPILIPSPKNKFESAHIYNAAAIVLDNKVFLLYRAQDSALKCSIGLAWSDDGFTFTRLSHPILEAGEEWEVGGGVEDPRITRINGIFYMTYTAYVLKTPRLCLATSVDLVQWKKYPPLFPDIIDVEINDQGRKQIRRGHSKAGVIFSEQSNKKDGNRRFFMLFGDSCLLLAESEDLIHWEASRRFDEFFAAPLLPWENRLIESGPPPVKTRDGKWILFYNAATTGAPGFRSNQYSVGQMLIDLERLEEGPLARVERPSLVVSDLNEREGLVNNVVFTEGLVQFQSKWLLYFGQGDSELGVAIAAVE